MTLGYSVAGALVGFLVGLTGVGGGSLMAPLLILLFGFSPSVAVGTDLWFAAITKSAGATIHRRSGSADWQIIRRLALGSIPAAILTLAALHFFSGGRLDARILLKILGAALIATALLTPMKDHLRLPMIRFRDTMGPSLRRKQFIATAFSGAVVGILVTLTSVGAGALVAIALMALYPLRLETRQLVATDIIHAVPLAFVAALGQAWLGNIDWTLLGMLLIGSIPGIILGSAIAGRVNEKIVRLALATMLAISGLKLLFS